MKPRKKRSIPDSKQKKNKPEKLEYLVGKDYSLQNHWKIYPFEGYDSSKKPPKKRETNKLDSWVTKTITVSPKKPTKRQRAKRKVKKVLRKLRFWETEKESEQKTINAIDRLIHTIPSDQRKNHEETKQRVYTTFSQGLSVVNADLSFHQIEFIITEVKKIDPKFRRTFILFVIPKIFRTLPTTKEKIGFKDRVNFVFGHKKSFKDKMNYALLGKKKEPIHQAFSEEELTKGFERVRKVLQRVKGIKIMNKNLFEMPEYANSFIHYMPMTFITENFKNFEEYTQLISRILKKSIKLIENKKDIPKNIQKYFSNDIFRYLLEMHYSKNLSHNLILELSKQIETLKSHKAISVFLDMANTFITTGKTETMIEQLNNTIPVLNHYMNGNHPLLDRVQPQSFFKIFTIELSPPEIEEVFKILRTEQNTQVSEALIIALTKTHFEPKDQSEKRLIRIHTTRKVLHYFAKRFGKELNRKNLEKIISSINSSKNPQFIMENIADFEAVFIKKLSSNFKRN